MCDHIIGKPVDGVNDQLAHQILHTLEDLNIFCINIMGAPGSGKTTLIEGIAPFLDKIAVIQGDLESDVDKQRLLKKNIPTYQINTHSGCHLTAHLINRALISMDLTGISFLFIENVGNLVCPAGMKIGQHMDIVLSSTTEGSDKPKKYPLIFLDASAIIITKTDLASAVEFDEAAYLADIKKINPKSAIFRVSKKEASSFSGIAGYIRDSAARKDHHHPGIVEP